MLSCPAKESISQDSSGLIMTRRLPRPFNLYSDFSSFLFTNPEKK
jgi:hypothetical protein